MARDKDIPIMAALRIATFPDSSFLKAVFPKHLRINPGTRDQVDWMLSHMRQMFEKPFVHHIVAIDMATNGEEMIVGFAEWEAPAPGEDRSNEMTTEQRAKVRAAVKLPQCIDADLLVSTQREIDSLVAACESRFEGKSKAKMWSKSMAKL